MITRSTIAALYRLAGPLFYNVVLVIELLVLFGRDIE